MKNEQKKNDRIDSVTSALCISDVDLEINDLREDAC